MPEIIYRADGGHPIGMGHVLRALRLAEQWLCLCPDMVVRLLTRDEPSVRRAIETRSPNNVHPIWLPARDNGILPVLDAADFESAASLFPPDIIIVDMLDTPTSEMRILSKMAPMLVSLDDRGDGREFSHLVSNFLVRDPDPSQMDGLRTWLREGPEYAPLGPDLADVVRRKHEPQEAGRVLVTLGGIDACGLVVKVVRALSTLPGVSEVDFALGAGRNYDEVKRIADGATWQANLHSSLPSLLPLYETADIAIVAGGITMHEVARCGVPSIAVCQPVDHQLLVAQQMEAEDCMVNLGYGEELSENRISEAVMNLAADHEKRQSMANAGPRVCNGGGAQRLAELVLARWAVVGKNVAEATLRAEAEQQHRKHEDFLRKVIDNMPCHVWVMDKECRFVLANRACAEFAGLDANDLEGKTYAGQWREDRPVCEIEEDDGFVLGTGRELEISDKMYIRPGDGKPEWFNVRKIPIFDHECAVEGMLGIAVCTTESKTAEQTLRQTEEFLRKVIDSIPCFVWVVDRKGKFVLANRACAEFADLDTNDLEDKTYKGQGFTDEIAYEIEEDDNYVMETGRVLEIPEKMYVRPRDGEQEWFYTTKIPLRNEAGKVDAMLGISVCTTDRKAVEDELRGALTALERSYEHQQIFLRNVTHEVRTPLTATVGYSKMLLEGMCGTLNTDQTGILNKIVASSDQLLGMVDAVLQITRLKSGSAEVRRFACSPVEVANTAVGLMLSQASDKGLQIEVIAGDDGAMAYYDRAKLIVMLQQLLSNAVKFTSKGSVHLYVSSVNKHAEFIVVDSGTGISQDQLPTIFDEFHQLASSSKHKSPGFGLGLAVVEMLVGIMDATLVVSSDHEVGTAITLCVPALGSE